MKRVSILCVSLLLSFVWVLPQNANAEIDEPTDLLSETSILIDATTGDVLAEEHPDKRMYPASITKIVTAILAIESGKMDEEVTISENAASTPGTQVYLVEGEKMTLRQLVQGLMINSGNDAAVAIAEHLSGSTEAFSEDMNTFVEEELGLSNTHFVNPNGLHDENHYSTASDMAKITQYALQLDEFKGIVSTKEMEWKGAEWETTLYNHHKLLWRYEGAIGVKNGYTSKSKHTLVTAASRNGTSLIVVTMKNDSSEQAYQDTVELLDYGFEHFQTEKIKKGTIISSPDGEEIKLNEDKMFTHKIGEGFETLINDKGNLVIKNEADEEIATFPLVPKTEKNSEVKAAIGKVGAEESQNPSFLPVLLKGSLWILLLLFVWNFIRKIKRRKKKRLRKKRMMAEINRRRGSI
ncbi:D-alanyl-D-alanine carboxypeptidase family protein [Pseudalkalibacillus salsuginis]|uniref:D-alanyl-D-alanine carboxypeptidase family protein n=1 Tax=Pseudalkalibacillus salsuginis TaxID=2910972 RepID=UPI001F3B50E7|nr:D-alanyl-D-alanine carboxypeptidase family protein [Pseudalkalibacillus salsuginis]MCF6411793.1 D-alanyl-D-alanine carboxypeptidase [Pseudalkalibacillus salsuginis]